MTALESENHTTPTPIQIGAIPPLLAGSDLLGIAQTGTGKTAAFTLPLLHRIAENPKPRLPQQCRALILAPTRELAGQIVERIQAYGAGLSVRTALIIGGASYAKQRAKLKRGVDILVATPGRLVDMTDSGAISLDAVEYFVLDEVDQMLDLGFIHSIRAIAAKLQKERQNIFFSATMPPAIAKLANALLNDPVRVEIEAAKPLKIDQSVIFVEKPHKAATLIQLLKDEEMSRGVVFTRTKHGADKLVRALTAAGETAHAIHGNRSQSQREKALSAFRAGKARLLVATDIAARGIDIRDVTHVVNFDLPNVPETYTHRIGRTGRAGKAGVAISFCANDERPYLRSIEKLTRQRIFVVGGAVNAGGGEPRPANDESGEERRRSGPPPRRKKRNSPGGFQDEARGDFKPRGKKPFNKERQNRQDDDSRHEGGKFEPGKFEGRKSDDRKTEDRKFDGRRKDNRKFDSDKPEGRRQDGRRFDERNNGEGRTFEGRRSEGGKFEGRNSEGRQSEGRKDGRRGPDSRQREDFRKDGRRFEERREDGQDRPAKRSGEGKPFERRSKEGGPKKPDARKHGKGPARNHDSNGGGNSPRRHKGAQSQNRSGRPARKAI